MVREGGRSFKVDQVHWDKLWCVIEGHALTVVNEVVSNVLGVTVVEVDSSTAVGIVTDVWGGDFTENTAVRLRRKRVVRA